MQQPEAGQRQLPAYKSHKTVWALKIADIQQSPADELSTVDGGTWRLIPENPGYGPITVPHSYVQKHAPQPGGYYVVYADGYASFSPAKAFEEGNTLIPANHLDRVREEKRELDEKIGRLSAFIKSPTYTTLSLEEQGDLHSQRLAMDLYSEYLQKRISHFADGPTTA